MGRAVLELREGGAAGDAVERHIELAVSAVHIQAEAEDGPGGHGRIGAAVVPVVLETEQDAVVAILLAKDLVVVASTAAPGGADAREDGDPRAHEEGVVQAGADAHPVPAGVVELRRTQAGQPGGPGGA